MIEKKFEYLEKLQNTITKDATKEGEKEEHNVLDENQLEHLFKETSTFSVSMIEQDADLNTANLEDVLEAKDYEAYFSDEEKYRISLFSTI